jgi:hypothetical protein
MEENGEKMKKLEEEEEEEEENFLSAGFVI